MLCCAALLFVLGLAREGWFLLPGTTRPAEVGFAPVARRAAPGVRATVTTAQQLTQPPSRHPAAQRPGRLATLVLALGLGTVGYAVGVYALLLLGLAEAGAGSTATWWLRDAALAALVLAAALGAARLPVTRRPPEVREVRGALLVGTGAAWWLLGILDMHVLGLLQVGGGALAADLLFHGLGAVLLLLGAWCCVRLPQPTAAPGPLQRKRVLHG